jgi:hypothetical protein
MQLKKDQRRKKFFIGVIALIVLPLDLDLLKFE